MTDALRHDPSAPVLITGGYGTVGAEIARMVALDAPTLLTGRSPERGRALAAVVRSAGALAPASANFAIGPWPG